MRKRKDEARANSPSELFPAWEALDKELQRRSAGGQIVLVGEAVLTKNVPDITDSLRQSVYASGVPRPRRSIRAIGNGDRRIKSGESSEIKL